MNLKEVAGSKKFLELLLEAVHFTGYRLIRRTLHMQPMLGSFGITPLLTVNGMKKSAVCIWILRYCCEPYNNIKNDIVHLKYILHMNHGN